MKMALNICWIKMLALILWSNFYQRILISGWQEVPRPCPGVSGSDIGLHHGLVPAMAQGCPDCRRWSLPLQVRHRMHRGCEAPTDPLDGHHPRRGGRKLCWILWKVSNSSFEWRIQFNNILLVNVGLIFFQYSRVQFSVSISLCVHHSVLCDDVVM